MTKPVTRKMAVDCLLYRFATQTKEIRFCAGDPGMGVVMDCPICKEPILPGQSLEFDHIHADVHGGSHEYQNLRPLHKDCHKIKSKRDVAANAKVKRLRGETKGRPKRKWAKQKMKSGKTKWPKRKFK